MAIRKELIDELLATSDGPLIGREGLSKELMKALVERMLGGGTEPPSGLREARRSGLWNR